MLLNFMNNVKELNLYVAMKSNSKWLRSFTELSPHEYTSLNTYKSIFAWCRNTVQYFIHIIYPAKKNENKTTGPHKQKTKKY